MARAVTKRKAGRPSPYQPEFDEIARRACLLNAATTDADLAMLFNVSTRAIDRWKVAHPSFKSAVEDGKHNADAAVANALYRRATGATVTEQKLDKDGRVHDLERELPPDVTAISLWLRNRSTLWRDQQVIEHKHSVDVGQWAKELERRFGPELARQVLERQGHDPNLITLEQSEYEEI